jgi:hypothetical protein
MTDSEINHKKMIRVGSDDGSKEELKSHYITFEILDRYSGEQNFVKAHIFLYGVRWPK